MTPAATAARNKTRVLIAFAAVYLLWGSTYLFIKYAIETIPPFLLGGARFFIAGGLLYALARWRGAPPATSRDWRMAGITGVLMLGAGNGAVVWSEQIVPSGVVALIVSTVPIWIVLLDWLRPRGVRPRTPVFLGLGLGLVGMVILIGPGAIVGQGHVNGTGALALFVGSLAWALGSIITRRGKRSAAPLVFSALQMVAAAVAMTVTSIVVGEPARFALRDVSMRSFLSWIYLIIAGSIIGYTAYIYLLGAVSAAKAATYAYVNPVIAVLLGWAFAREPISARTILAAAVILGGVAIITVTQGQAQPTGEYPIPREAGSRDRAA